LNKDSPAQGNNQIGAKLTSIKQSRFKPPAQRQPLDLPAAEKYIEANPLHFAWV
jgi:hypothetical protein